MPPYTPYTIPPWANDTAPALNATRATAMGQGIVDAQTRVEQLVASEPVDVKRELGLGGFARVMTLRAQMNAGSNIVQVNEDVTGLTTNHYLDIYGGGAVRSDVGQPWHNVAAPLFTKITAVDTVNKNITVQDPAVTNVPIGRMVVKDDHIPLQNLANQLNTAGYGAVLFQPGIYPVAHDVRFYSNVAVMGKPGNFIQAVPEMKAFLGTENNHRSLLWTAGGADNIAFLGVGLDGNRSAQSQWRPGLYEENHTLIQCDDSSNIYIQRCNLKNMVGDGIIFFGGVGVGDPTHGVRGGWILDSRFAANNDHRNAISLVAGEDIWVERNRFYKTARVDMPGDIDLEPIYTGSFLRNITISNNKHDHRSDSVIAPNAIVVGGGNASLDIDIQDIEISNNQILGPQLRCAIGIGALRKNAENIYVDGNSIRNARIAFELQDDGVAVFGPNNRVSGTLLPHYEYWSGFAGSSFGFSGVNQALNRDYTGGRFGGILDPANRQMPTTAAFSESKNMRGWNNALTSSGKFIYNNTSFGGSAGSLTQDVIDLMQATGRYDTAYSMGASQNIAARYGTEFYVGQEVAANTGSSYTPNDALVRHFVFYSDSRFNYGLHGICTYAFWVRLKTVAGANPGSFVIRRATTGFRTRIIVDGVEVTTDDAFIAWNDGTAAHKGWHHVVIQEQSVTGINSLPNLYASLGDTVQVALLAVFDGPVELRPVAHIAPIQTAVDDPAMNSYHAPPKVINTTPYTALWNDHTLLVDTTSAAITINLPSAVGMAGKEYRIVRTNAGANAVTIDPSGAQTWQGTATRLLSAQWAEARGESDGANWV